MHTRAMRRLLSVIAQMICFCVVAAQAQPYPSRPITIVVALPAGGAVDALARIIAEPMRSMLGQPIVIENLGGAGGTLAVGRVVRAVPDGYTLGLGTVGQYVISGAVYTLPFDMLADLTPVAPLPSVPYWMTARKTLPANNLNGSNTTTPRHRPSAPRAWPVSAAWHSRRRVGRTSSSYPIVAARRRCRTWSPATST
jgi:tripartite-type tricarboxylate transporter receptor subunit TctC